MAAAMILIEIGDDLSRFGSADRLASWAALCPGNNESAGKRKSGKTRKPHPPRAPTNSEYPLHLSAREGPFHCTTPNHLPKCLN